MIPIKLGASTPSIRQRQPLGTTWHTSAPGDDIPTLALFDDTERQGNLFQLNQSGDTGKRGATFRRSIVGFLFFALLRLNARYAYVPKGHPARGVLKSPVRLN